MISFMSDPHTPDQPKPPGHAHFDGMTWPLAGQRCAEVEWTLRYGEPTREELLEAASILAAYYQMVHDPRSKRESVIRELRKAGSHREPHDHR